MPIYLRRETKERPMHDQDPSDSPRLAAADLTEVAGMMRGLSALAAKRGRPLPLNDTSYTASKVGCDLRTPRQLISPIAPSRSSCNLGFSLVVRRYCIDG